jgi:hypothetical protein
MANDRRYTMWKERYAGRASARGQPWCQAARLGGLDQLMRTLLRQRRQTLVFRICRSCRAGRWTHESAGPIHSGVES